MTHKLQEWKFRMPNREMTTTTTTKNSIGKRRMNWKRRNKKCTHYSDTCTKWDSKMLLLFVHIAKMIANLYASVARYTLEEERIKIERKYNGDGWMDVRMNGKWKFLKKIFGYFFPSLVTIHSLFLVLRFLHITKCWHIQIACWNSMEFVCIFACRSM